jgi:predicted DNA-binding protein with PD1-like motif
MEQIMVTGAKMLKTVFDGLPLMEKILFHLANLYGEKEHYTVKVLGSEATEVLVLWGAFQFKRGPQLHIHLHCTQKAFTVVHSHMMRSAVQFHSRIRATN